MEPAKTINTSPILICYFYQLLSLFIQRCDNYWQEKNIPFFWGKSLVYRRSVESSDTVFGDECYSNKKESSFFICQRISFSFMDRIVS